jgi:hypothetical protein
MKNKASTCRKSGPFFVQVAQKTGGLKKGNSGNPYKQRHLLKQWEAILSVF